MRRLSVLPLLCFGIMFAYACYGALIVGHWPYYAHPDPKELPARMLLPIVGLVMLLGAASVVCTPVAYLIWRMIGSQRNAPTAGHRPWALLYLAGASIWLLDSAASHGRMPWHSVIGWIAD